jgi:hypothetical protein
MCGGRQGDELSQGELRQDVQSQGEQSQGEQSSDQSLGPRGCACCSPSYLPLAKAHLPSSLQVRPARRCRRGTPRRCRAAAS